MFALTLSSCGGLPSMSTTPSTPQTHTVTWRNWNDNVLKIDRNVTHGSWPEYTGRTPTKAEDYYNTYTFSGWTPELRAVTADAEYKAVFTEVPKPMYYTVTFNTNGGSSIASKSVRQGETVARPADPRKTDYNFAGWFSDSGLTREYDFSTPVNSDLTLFAKWTTTEYMVTFNLNYDNLPTVTYSTVDGYVAYRPTRNGYTFNGWWLCAGFLDGQPILNEAFSFETRVTSSDLVLYAEWVEAKLTSNELDAPVVTINGDRISWQEVPNATKYQLILAKNSVEHMNQQVYYTSFTFPSSYEAGKYTIKVRAIGDGMTYYNSAYSSKTYAHKTLTSLTGLSFDENTGILSWKEVPNATEYELLLDNLNYFYTTSTQYDFAELYAGSHKVQVTATRSGWVSSKSTVSFAIHRLTAPINLMAVLDEETLDYEVTWDEVRMGNGYANSYFVYLNDVKVSTVYTNKYTVNQNSSYYSNGYLTISIAAYDENSDYLISPKSEPLSLTQYFEINYVLNGGDNNPDNPSLYTVMDAVIFANPTKNGYEFLGWFSGDNVVTGIPAGSRGTVNVEARWNAILNNLSVTSQDISKGTVAITSGVGYSDESITVVATPVDDCIFKGWYHESTKVSNDATFIFIMPTYDYSLVAHFFTQSEEVEEELAKKYGTKPIVSDDGKKITYGLYPQTNVNDSTLLSFLNALTTPECNGWYLYDGDYYAKVNAVPYRTNYVFDNGVTIVNDATYWFKCEPITWDVLSNNNGEYYIVSSVLLDAQCYYNSTSTRTIGGQTIYPNDYKYSDIRTWLNTDFYNSAFALENEHIQITTVDNSAATTEIASNSYVCENTEDKVFLPSYQDYINSNYGFQISTDSTSLRCCITTDWARARGIYYYTSSGFNQYCCSYWTRSPCNSNNPVYVSAIAPDGRLSFNGVNHGDCGVRPALSIKIA